MLKHSKFALNVPFFVRHENFLHLRLGNLQEVSQGSVHIYTYVESDGAVLKKTEFVDAMMSGDGVELSRRTPTTIAAICEDGVLAKSRE